MHEHDTKNNPDESDIISFLSNALSPEEIEIIITQYKSVKNWFQLDTRSLPKPVWARRGFKHTGKEAWHYLTEQTDALKTKTPLSIYIHVPFCEHKCWFCDLYSIPMPERSRHMENKYAETIIHEIKEWSRLKPIARRPVTTVHLGGGTPNFLSTSILKKMVTACRDSFKTTSHTEWALESTSRLITKNHLSRLKDLGFDRLHVGVQTLEDATRRIIGRKESGEMVLKKLKDALNKNFVVSVDIIYGLPGQTVKQLLKTLEQLVELGIHGFSLYELQISKKNQGSLLKRGIERQKPILSYTLFQAAEQYLRRKGYQKNHFTHFARAEDKNLYYRHAKRGEDLLAMGPTADGIFGSYLYRHPDYRNYTKFPNSFLEGGILESPAEQKLRPVSASLMAASISQSRLQAIGADHLLELWVACDMLKQTEKIEDFQLTANGSWFISSMLEQLKACVESQQ